MMETKNFQKYLLNFLLLLDVRCKNIVAYSMWFFWRTQERLTERTLTYYSKLFQVRQVKNLSLWRTSVRNVRLLSHPATRCSTLLQAIIVCIFKENEWTKLEKMAKKLVLGPILAHLGQIPTVKTFFQKSGSVSH